MRGIHLSLSVELAWRLKRREIALVICGLNRAVFSVSCMVFCAGICSEVDFGKLIQAEVCGIIRSKFREGLVKNAVERAVPLPLNR
jgi:hypothetical protein